MLTERLKRAELSMRALYNSLLYFACISIALSCSNAWSQDSPDIGGRTDPLLEQINGRVHKPQLSVSKFEQHNYIKALSAPLISHGEVYIDANVGVAWYVNSPLSSKVIISDLGIDTGTGLINSSRTIAHLLQGLITGNLSSVQNLFAVTAEIHEEGWSLLLIPKEPQLLERIESLNLQGNYHVDKLTVQQPTGNRIEIVFEPPNSLTELPATVHDELNANAP